MKNRSQFWRYLPFIITLILVLIVSLQKYFADPVLFFGEYHTQYNNYKIFVYSSQHLLNGQDLYTLYPQEYGDLFKYSPTFAWLFIPFSYLPDWLGLICWNLLNTLPLVYALYLLANKRVNEFLPVFFIMAIEMATSLHNAQSNGLVSALLLGFYLCLMNRRFFWSGLFLALSVYIKLFGGLAILLIFLFPDWRKHAFSFAMWMFILFFAPLVSVSVYEVMAHYRSWIELLKNDPSHSLNFSIATVIDRYSPREINNLPIYVHVIGITMLGLVIWKAWKSNQAERLSYLLPAFIMMWFVMFNHKSESPTYVIAMVGVAILWIPLHQKKLFRILMAFAIICVSLASTDLVPFEVRQNVMFPMQIKAVGLIPIFVYTFALILQQSSLSKSN